MFLERVEKKACENDGMVVKEEVRYSFRPTNPPGISGSQVYQEEQGKTLGVHYVRIWGRSNGTGQKMLVIQYCTCPGELESRSFPRWEAMLFGSAVRQTGCPESQSHQPAAEKETDFIHVARCRGPAKLAPYLRESRGGG